jgi:hypothetical protein
MEGKNSLNQQNNCQIQKTSNTTFTLIKNSFSYLLSFKFKTQTININVKRIMSTSIYEGLFSIDDLKAYGRVFNLYDNLGEIYQELLQKLNEEKVEFNEEEDKFILKFDFQFESKKMEAVLKLNKSNQGDLVKVIDEMGEVIRNNTDLIKELQAKIAKLEERSVEAGNNSDIKELQAKFGSVEVSSKSDVKELQAKIAIQEQRIIDMDKVLLKNTDIIKELQAKIGSVEVSSKSDVKELKEKQDQRFFEMDKVILKNTEIIKELQDKISKYEEKNASKYEEKSITQEIISNDGLEYSKILKNENIQLIKKWIDEKNFTSIQFKLLYRGTEHGKEGKDFHSRCDNKGSTITFIKTNKSRVFGGFTNLEWESPSSGTPKANDPQAFIFSIDTKTKLTCHDQRYVIYCNSSYGPTFGNGCDMAISNNWDSNNTHSNCGVSYGKNENITSKYYLTGITYNSTKFTPVEVEVYQVLKL